MPGRRDAATPPCQQRGWHPTAPAHLGPAPRPVLRGTRPDLARPLREQFMPCQRTRGVRGPVMLAPSGKKAGVLHLHWLTEERSATVDSPRKGQRDRVRPGVLGRDSSSQGWPNPGSGATSILGDPDLTPTLAMLGAGPEGPEVPSSLRPSGMRMVVEKEGIGPISNPREQQCPPHHPPSRQEMGRAGDGSGRWMARAIPAPSGGAFPTQRARSPEREKEKAEGLGK